MTSKLLTANAPENLMLGRQAFPLGTRPIFRGELLVPQRVIIFQTCFERLEVPWFFRHQSQHLMDFQPHRTPTTPTLFIRRSLKEKIDREATKPEDLWVPPQVVIEWIHVLHIAWFSWLKCEWNVPGIHESYGVFISTPWKINILDLQIIPLWTWKSYEPKPSQT